MTIPVILGADGGGTKTNFLALHAVSGEILARSSTEGTNRYALGIEETARRILQGIRELRLPSHFLPTAFAFGDPAMDDEAPADGEELRSLLRRELGIPVYSKSDVFMALFALTRGAPGALLIAGTGSMGVALTEPWDPSRPAAPYTVGGWGYPSTDGGSGFSIAVKGITAAFDAFDGISRPTALCDAVLAHFSCSRPRALIDLFNGGTLSKSKLASFAVAVDACAQKGDPAAQAIMDQAAKRLSAYALSMLSKLPETHRHLGLFGSVLVNNRLLRQRVEKQVLETFPEARIEIPAMPPEWGAAQYAICALGGNQ